MNNCIEGVMTLKNVMILSGGTSTAWHIAQVLRSFFNDYIYLIVCDINEQNLVHTATLADEFLTVPAIKSSGYYDFMLSCIREKKVDILIPLIDDDILLFSCDNPDLISLGVCSTAPTSLVTEALSNKKKLWNTLNKIKVATPFVYNNAAELNPTLQYFVKNEVGCGSRGVELINGAIAGRLLQDGKVVQEVCSKPEITVDVVHKENRVYTICRERKETKLGVSTKCRVYYDAEIQAIMERIVSCIALPSVCCVQFMKNSNGEWALIDFNLRSGGGTAISAAVGFQAVRFAAAGWLGLPGDAAWVPEIKSEHYVVRAYQEIVTL